MQQNSSSNITFKQLFVAAYLKEFLSEWSDGINDVSNHTIAQLINDAEEAFDEIVNN